MEQINIIGIVTIKNEDVYVRQALLNILSFCDTVIVAENYSQDRTYEIVSELARQHPKIELHRFHKFYEGHRLIERFVGTNTWVFGVDGDEIYDPAGLAVMRQRLLAGEFLEQWCLFGNVLHCVSLDMTQRMARGYLSPPARSMTKLYNFSIITQWTNCTERLHNGTLLFKAGHNAEQRHDIWKDSDWENSPFRCLHTVFLPRSSLVASGQSGRRFNPDELMRQRGEQLGTGWIRRLVSKIQWQARFLLRQDWKSQRYRRGALVEKTVEAFFPSI